jgi:hypothetical protein
VNRYIGRTIKQCGFKLFDEDPFAAHLTERGRFIPVTQRSHANNFTLQFGMRGFEQAFDVIGLPQSQCALACSDSKFFHPVIVTGGSSRGTH